MNRHEDRTPFSGGGLSEPVDDAALDRLLASLPREVTNEEFTRAVLRRVEEQDAHSQGSLRGSGGDTKETSLGARASRLADLLFGSLWSGSRLSYLSLLAASALVALVMGLGWASFAPASKDRSPSRMARTDSPPSVEQASPEVDTFRGQPVTTARPFGPAASFSPRSNVPSARQLEIQALQADRARLQRELMILRQLAAEGSPMIEVGSNGEVDFFIDLGEFIEVPVDRRSASGERIRDDEHREPQQF